MIDLKEENLALLLQGRIDGDTINSIKSILIISN